MPIFDKNVATKYSAAGDAKLREQKRQSEIETIARNKEIPVFMFRAFGFRPIYRVNSPGRYNLEGPLCPKANIKDQNCFTVLEEKEASSNVICPVCGFSANLPEPMQLFRETAHKAYDGFVRYTESGNNIQTLDVPYDAIKAMSEDQKRKIEIKWSQKDGRNQAVIYFIEKHQNTDGTKSQVFVDMDHEDIRYDASDNHPGKIVAEIKATFKSTNIDVTYKLSDPDHGKKDNK